MIAVCSDLDETPDRHIYWESMRFLNATEPTAMGDGVGLEIGNSIYFDMPDQKFSYWNTDDTGRAMIRSLIHSGHIDCLHSYGDLANQRADAERAINELNSHECQLRVWVDHSKAPTNFGPDIMAGHGDEVNHKAYHADLTLQYGIQYVWRGRTTGINGQNVPITVGALGRMMDRHHPLTSSANTARQMVKIYLGRHGHCRWEMYATNQACRPSTLRSGHRIWEFMRSNPFWGGSGEAATADGIAHVMTEQMLSDLVQCGGICFLYTHLGKVADPRQAFNPATQQAFHRLAQYVRNGRILVRTTHRLLRYLTVRDSLDYRSERQGNTLIITIESISDPVSGLRQPSSDDLQGITFVVDRCERIELCKGVNTPIHCEVFHEGQSSYIVVPWKMLQLPRYEDG